MLETNLIGRQFEDYHKNIHTIVEVYLDRGKIQLIIESPERQLWVTDLNPSFKLLLEKDNQ